MEKVYKLLKIAVLILVLAVVAVGIWRIAAPAETESPVVETPVIEPPTEESTENPNLAPDFTVYDVDGNTFKLSDFRGKPVILNFWASWCGPCKAEMPEFETAYTEYGDQIHFLIVDLVDGYSETVGSGSGYIAEMGYTFPVYFDTDMEAAIAYQISAIPTTVFLDAEGVATYSHVGMLDAQTLQANIDVLLGTN